jgi:hypothetical protein
MERGVRVAVCTIARAAGLASALVDWREGVTGGLVTAQADYDRFRALRDDLLAVVGGLGAVATDLGLHTRAAHLQQVDARLRDSRFRLMVLGEFKRGKSTLVNALLGASVLPARVAPCTGMITVVRYGDPPSARLLPAEPGAEAVDVPLDRIRDFITISLDRDEPDRPPAADAPVPRFELFHPLPLLDNGVELVDSPGLNEHAIRTALALEDLPRADAVVLVLSCEQQLGHTEQAFLDRQLVPGPDGSLANVFFVWNRFDAIADDPAEVAALDALTNRVLTPRLGGRPRVFRMSARDALLGRVKADVERLERSGVLEFEAGLARFLTTERGRVKLLGPLQTASGTLAELRDSVIVEREAMLRAPVDALLQQLDDLQPRLEGVRQQRVALVAALRARRVALSRRLRVLLGIFGSRVREGLPDTIDRVQVQWAGAAWNRATVVDGLGDYLQEWLEQEAARFEDDEVRPTLEREARELDALLEDRLSDILGELDALRTELRPRLHEPSESSRPDLSATERVLSALGGFVMGGPGGAVEGATFGWRNVVGGLPVYLSVGLALALTGVSLPVALSVVTGVGVLRTWLTGKDAAERLREDVQKGFSDAFDRELARMAVRVEDEVSARYARLVDAVDQATGAVIAELEEELAEVRQRHAEGEEALQEGISALSGLKLRLATLDGQLAAVRARLAQ